MMLNETLTHHELNPSDLIDKIKANESFQMVHLPYCFWKSQVEFRKLLDSSSLEGDWKNIFASINFAFPIDVYTELLQRLKSLANYPTLYIGVSDQIYISKKEIERTEVEVKNRIYKEWMELIPKGTTLFDGMFWKDAIVDGSIVHFLHTIKDKSILTVGQEHVRSFNHLCGFSDASFFLIDLVKPGYLLEDIFADFSKQLTAKNPRICLIQIKPVIAFIVILRLIKLFPDITFIDMDQVLSIGSLRVIEKEPWYRANPREVAESINHLNPRWKKNSLTFKGSQYEKWDSSQRWDAFYHHLDPQLKIDYDLLTLLDRRKIKKKPTVLLPPSTKKQLFRLKSYLPFSRKRIEFIESLVQSFLQVKKEHYPVYCQNVSQAFKVILQSASLLKTGDTANLIAPSLLISSQNSLLETLMSLKYVHFIDCNKHGLPSLWEAHKLRKDLWDALVVSNVFGLLKMLHRYDKFCMQKNKLLIIDYGYGLPTPELINQAPNAFHLINSGSFDLNFNQESLFLIAPTAYKDKIKKNTSLLNRELSYQEMKIIYSKVLNFNHVHWMGARLQNRLEPIFKNAGIKYLNANNQSFRIEPFVVNTFSTTSNSPHADSPFSFEIFSYKSVSQNTPMAQLFALEKKFFFNLKLSQVPSADIKKTFQNLVSQRVLKKTSENPEKPGQDLTTERIKKYAKQLIKEAQGNKLLIPSVKKYCLLSTQRSGSTLFSTLLKQNELGFVEEWFNPIYMNAVADLMMWPQIDMKKYIELAILGSMNIEHGIFGVNIHINHLLAHRAKGFDLLKQIKFDKIYAIERKNKFNQAYSYAKAFKTACWDKDAEVKAGFSEGIEVQIKKNEFLYALNLLTPQYDMFDKMIRSEVDRCFLYEDIVESGFENILKQIFSDFKLNPSNLKLDFPIKKQGTSQDESNIEILKKSILDEMIFSKEEIFE